MISHSPVLVGCRLVDTKEENESTCTIVCVEALGRCYEHGVILVQTDEQAYGRAAEQIYTTDEIIGHRFIYYGRSTHWEGLIFGQVFLEICTSKCSIDRLCITIVDQYVHCGQCTMDSVPSTVYYGQCTIWAV